MKFVCAYIVTNDPFMRNSLSTGSHGCACSTGRTGQFDPILRNSVCVAPSKSSAGYRIYFLVCAILFRTRFWISTSSDCGRTNCEHRICTANTNNSSDNFRSQIAQFNQVRFSFIHTRWNVWVKFVICWVLHLKQNGKTAKPSRIWQICDAIDPDQFRSLLNLL